MLVESQSEGSLSDITVGRNIGVRGQRNDDGSVNAQGIIVAPAGERAGGRVTAVDGGTITVEDRDGLVTTITTGDETTFRLGRTETGSIADVTVDTVVMAFGPAQGDNTLAARLVFVNEAGRGQRGPGHGPGAAGEVIAVDGSSFSLAPILGQADLTIQTNDETEYRSRSGQAVSLADIQAGKIVMVIGRPVEGQENTILARLIGIKID
jgi:hypothetical protein